MIHNFIVDYNRSTKINTIEYSNIEAVNTFTRKIKFYNPEISEPLHKFWYFVPNAKLIKKNSGVLTMALSSIDTNLIESLKNLDEKTDKILKKINQMIKISPSIKMSSNFPPVLDVYADTDSRFYDQDNKSIMYMNIKNNSKIQLYMEFDSVTIGSNRCEKKWKVIQLKENKPIDLSANMFDMVPMIPQMIYPVLPPQQQPYYPPNLQQQPYYPPNPRNIPIPPPSLPQSVPQRPIQKEEKIPDSQTSGSIFQPPSQDQLLSMIGKLKKPTKKTEKTNVDVKKDNDQKTSSVHTSIPCAPPPPPLVIEKQEDKISEIHSDQDINKGLTINNDEEYRKDILDMIKEQTKYFNRDKKAFNNDVKMAKEIMDKIESIILETEINNRQKEEENSVSKANNDEESDDEDPFAIIPSKKNESETTKNTHSKARTLFI
jgi:hypothetical protein